MNECGERRFVRAVRGFNNNRREASIIIEQRRAAVRESCQRLELYL